MLSSAVASPVPGRQFVGCACGWQPVTFRTMRHLTAPRKNASAAFVMMYYGRWPFYWELWARSAANNPQFDFIILTDLPRPSFLPENVHLVSIGLDEVMIRLSAVLGFPTRRPESVHKLADFKAWLGLAFADLLEGYSYWGYCDLDLVFGDLTPLKQAVDSSRADFISPWDHTVGHCTLIRNASEVNEATLTIPDLENRLHLPHTTFCDEGGLAEACIVKGGFSFYGVQSLAAESRKQRPFVGATFFFDRQLYGFDQFWPYAVTCADRAVHVIGPDGNVHEVLYFHFMAGKAARLWEPLGASPQVPFSWLPFGAVPAIVAADYLQRPDVRVRSEWERLRAKSYLQARDLVPSDWLRTYKQMRHRRKSGRAGVASG